MKCEIIEAATSTTAAAVAVAVAAYVESVVLCA